MRPAAAIGGPHALDAVGEAGFAAVELPEPPPEATAERLGAAGLALAGVVLAIRPTSSRVEQQRVVEEALDLISAVGDTTRTVVLLLASSDDPERVAAAGQIEEHRYLWTQGSRLGTVADATHRAADRVRDRGLQAAFLPRLGTAIETPREIDRLAYALDPDLLGLAFDAGGWTADPLAYVAEFAELTRYVRVGLGAGALDVVAPLRAKGYGGWVTASVGDGLPELAQAREELAAAGVD